MHFALSKLWKQYSIKTYWCIIFVKLSGVKKYPRPSKNKCVILKKKFQYDYVGGNKGDGYIQISIENSTKHRINILGVGGKGK